VELVTVKDDNFNLVGEKLKLFIGRNAKEVSFYRSHEIAVNETTKKVEGIKYYNDFILSKERSSGKLVRINIDTKEERLVAPECGPIHLYFEKGNDRIVTDISINDVLEIYDDKLIIHINPLVGGELITFIFE
jgi:hypothetical protein